MTQERASDEAFVIEPDGRIHDLRRAHIRPSIPELERAIGGTHQLLELDGRAGLAMLTLEHEAMDGRQHNERASRLANTEIRGPVIVIAKRLVLQ